MDDRPTDPVRGTRAAPLPPEQRRLAIIEAIKPLVVEHGSAVTTRQIAETAGIAEGTVFKAFESKDALLDAVVDAIIDTTDSERALAELDHDVDTDDEFAELLVVVTGLIADRISTVWRVLARTPGRAPKKPMPDSPGLDAIFAHHRERIRLEPDGASRLLRSLTWSLTSPQLTTTPATPERIVDLFLNGAAR